MKHVICLASVFIFSTTSWGQDFSPFQSLLNKYLQTTELAGGGQQTAFNYSATYKDKDTFSLISKQVALLKDFNPEQLKKKNQALAFWINAYNFFMVKAVLEKGFKNKKLNINSVKDLGSFFNPYRVFKTEEHIINNKKFSLDGIEKEILLGANFKKKNWKDARIHFAVNCASVGCPPLLSKIYQSTSLDQALDFNIKKALSTSRHFSIKGRTLHLTHLFKWYKDDFKEHSGSVRNFLTKYITDPQILTALKQTQSIQFIEYNWKLNRPENF